MHGDHYEKLLKVLYCCETLVFLAVTMKITFFQSVKCLKDRDAEATEIITSEASLCMLARDNISDCPIKR
jgi:hypothetical protein